MKHSRSADGKVLVNGSKFDQLTGSRAQVWHGTAYRTSGKLSKNDLMQNKNGRIVSRSKHHSEKKKKTLFHLGFRPQKGKFGLPGHRTRRRKRHH